MNGSDAISVEKACRPPFLRLPCGFLLKSAQAQNRCDICHGDNIDSVPFAQNSAIDLLICALGAEDG
ncbi:hypothetical protein IB267_13905 [Ensifer sp. ENS09]|uniref:hypothetical protein n=1 Tax=Ensifer sp. ENS09 TaxID=2769263 RepID=UPI0017869BFD|nr:hypothetical protein [Ensifer sp. ENS09]MBD9649453.1 hypothetical protein [Ensifer sp. ENS09]